MNFEENDCIGYPVVAFLRPAESKRMKLGGGEARYFMRSKHILASTIGSNRWVNGDVEAGTLRNIYIGKGLK